MSLSAIEVLLARYPCTVIEIKMMFDAQENIILNHVSTSERAESRLAINSKMNHAVIPTKGNVRHYFQDAVQHSRRIIPVFTLVDYKPCGTWNEIRCSAPIEEMEMDTIEFDETKIISIENRYKIGKFQAIE